MRGVSFALHVVPFTVGLVLGMVYIAFADPRPQPTPRFPSPENAGQVLYRTAAAGDCYRIRAAEAPCGPKTVAQPAPDAAAVPGAIV